MTRERES